MDPALRPSTLLRSSKLFSPYDLGNKKTIDKERDYFFEDWGPSCVVSKMVPSLEPNDVILGRGFRYAWHSGNNDFQALVRKNIQRYDEAKRKNDKSRVVQEIYELVTRKGRFLKKDELTGLYEVVEEQVAKEKISQAIRYKKRRFVRSTDPVGAASSVSSTDSPQSMGHRRARRASRQLELFDNNTLHSVLGPSSFQWPDVSQFEELTAFFDIREMPRSIPCPGLVPPINSRSYICPLPRLAGD
mmetsp:Transcript_10178/g.19537  ORF Transcript_10178/g.19537 Transcript_10178/m.19537 type:complete len:244 (-) Transcript_10178:269-1000(-)|eukprot:scaffold8374_cov175-Amphora_coffeaeformis.AAC.24